MTNDGFTLSFALETSVDESTRATHSPAEREREFVREQIGILLRYVTLYSDGHRLDPDAFAIVNMPDQLFPLAWKGAR